MKAKYFLLLFLVSILAIGTVFAGGKKEKPSVQQRTDDSYQKNYNTNSEPGLSSEKPEAIYKQVMVDGTIQGRWVVESSRSEYDINGNRIYYKSPFGTEQWNEYDQNGNLLHSLFSYGEEHWYEYDQNGNLFHSLLSNEEEKWYEYDADGKLCYFIHLWSSMEKAISKYFDTDGPFFGEQIWYEYDDCGNMIHSMSSYLKEELNKEDYKKSENIEPFYEQRWNEYDDRGNCIHYITANGDDWKECWDDYDSNSNLLHSKGLSSVSGSVSEWEYWYEYDSNGRLILSKDSNEELRWCIYDDEKRTSTQIKLDPVSRELSEIDEDYDEKGNCIHYYSLIYGMISEDWTEYEYYDSSDQIKTETKYTPFFPDISEQDSVDISSHIDRYFQ